MKPARFRATILAGHKDAALEVPFDPAARWGIEPARLRRGRNGFRVRATANGVSVETAIVPRSRRFWLELSDDALHTLRAHAGDVIAVAVVPL